MAGETLVYWRAGFSPALSLLIPTFSFPKAPVNLTIYLQRRWNALLPFQIEIHSFGIQFNARLLSTLDRSTSELLRTL